ncbi:DJ-1 family glyoxalase III [Synoicihabitans lomoniglobus]|uniref:DJ-1/PfpI family protein n=1 Tax=Synoicihabitans lomoniglobus TaxID=2909285 RepID=A0AAF0I847_9BACT|nr:DJ-1/PfpI family protein [Opitutaceae bacterium LMO-M01]WED67321.1 DJ-1/PfpI family protein [Opitutaceae bacterium LMO-M01]
MATVLVILPEGFEEIEAITPIDIWRRAGFTVKTAALGPKLTVTGRSEITVHADILLSAVGPGEVFDVLFIPGGPGVAHLRASLEVRELLGRHVAADRWIAAICAAPLVLHDAGLLAGKRYTAHPSAATELSSILADEKVVIDGHIITSRGAGTTLDFALTVVQSTAGRELAEKVAVSICAQASS